MLVCRGKSDRSWFIKRKMMRSPYGSVWKHVYAVLQWLHFGIIVRIVLIPWAPESFLCYKNTVCMNFSLSSHPSSLPPSFLFIYFFISMNLESKQKEQRMQRKALRSQLARWHYPAGCKARAPGALCVGGLLSNREKVGGQWVGLSTGFCNAVLGSLAPGSI